MLRYLMQMFLSLPISVKALKTVINDGSNIFLTVLSLRQHVAAVQAVSYPAMFTFSL